MKKTDLYEIVIKTLGLYMVVPLIADFRNVLMYVSIWLQHNENPELFGNFNQTPLLLVAVLGLALTLSFSFVLLFKTKALVQFITKKENAEEKINLLAEKRELFEISLVILGLILLVFDLPDFIYKLKNHIQLVQANLQPDHNATIFLTTTAIKIVLGFFLLKFSRTLSALLIAEKKQSD
jgi:NADH:ubiquinone oxidoreductase subunit 5 (subunit L)/multisubunit Na+/H+ antiporter MnhA subunit